MPNSFLWIGLVVVWLFVLVPMLVNNRPRIWQTSDAALATRVLYRGDQRPVRRGPAAGHRSDPYWQEEPDHFGYDAEDLVDTHAEEDDFDGEQDPVDEYVPARRGRGGFDPEADAIAREAKYAFRQRLVLGLVLATIATAALGLIISPLMWWAFVACLVGLVGYMAYLRQQVQIEREVRRRRTARLGRSRLGVESRSDEELRMIPARLRRPGVVVLEVDDGDPEFDHLEHFDEEPMYQTTLRRAAGE
ncbi:divisome protein SepX/GlpR [Rhodococcus marinonascens]|uniref:divisome protein SepX/GlpR n=1 Tax=Rhodococcus marinonascens TaxID=38311 RepID=UPI0009354EC8|nr:gephyrin-like molybdotransferase receptor GlpR [Rhodococcus marinonascens]